MLVLVSNTLYVINVLIGCMFGVNTVGRVCVFVMLNVGPTGQPIVKSVTILLSCDFDSDPIG
jgi:hypothetical protein